MGLVATIKKTPLYRRWKRFRTRLWDRIEEVRERARSRRTVLDALLANDTAVLKAIAFLVEHAQGEAALGSSRRVAGPDGELLGRDAPSLPSPRSDGLGMEAALAGLATRGYSPSVIYDIGAADGVWSRQAARLWQQARLVCFEPLVEHRQALAALKEDLPGRVTVIECGCGDTDTQLRIGVTDFLYDSSFAYSGTSSREVPVFRLDTLLATREIPPPSFIKIDVQGFEKRLMDGGAKALESADCVLLECTFFAFCAEMRTLDVTVAYMSERGFVPYEFVDFLRRPLDGAMGQCDILFVKRGHALLADARWAR